MIAQCQLKFFGGPRDGEVIEFSLRPGETFPVPADPEYVLMSDERGDVYASHETPDGRMCIHVLHESIADRL